MGKHVPAERPARIDGEDAFRADHAARFCWVGRSATVLRSERECLRILLVDAGDLEVVVAVVEALPPFGLAEEALLRIVAARERQVVGRRKREIVGDVDADAEVGLVAYARDQEAGLALDGRVGTSKTGK